MRRMSCKDDLWAVKESNRREMGAFKMEISSFIIIIFFIVI